MHSSGCGCSEQITVPEPCGCTPAPIPIPNNCRAPVQMSEIAPLVWVYGLDALNCRKYQAVADVLGLIACDGSPVNAATPLVTCALFGSRLCTTLAALAPGGVAGPTTKLVGADCATYTLPSTDQITVEDTDTVDLTLSSLVLTADVIVSPRDGNILVALDDGLFAPAHTDQNVVGTECIEVVDGEGDRVVRLIISEDDCNAASCTSDGLLVRESTSAGSMTTEVVQCDQPVNEGTVLELPLVTLDVSNPSSCRSAVLSLHLQTPSYCTTGSTPVQTLFELLVQFLLTGINSGPEFVLTSTSFNGSNDSSVAYDRGWVYTVPADFVGSVTARVRVTQVTGDQDNVNVVSPILRYHLSTI